MNAAIWAGSVAFPDRRAVFDIGAIRGTTNGFGWATLVGGGFSRVRRGCSSGRFVSRRFDSGRVF